MLLLELNPKLHQAIHSVKRDESRSDKNLAANPLSQQESFAVKKVFSDVRVSQLVGVQSSWN